MLPWSAIPMYSTMPGSLVRRLLTRTTSCPCAKASHISASHREQSAISPRTAIRHAHDRATFQRALSPRPFVTAVLDQYNFRRNNGSSSSSNHPGSAAPGEGRIRPVAPSRCWKCLTKPKDSGDSLLFCSHCNSLMDVPENLNYFQLYGLDVKFRIDLKDLAQKQKYMQTLLHPDKHVRKSEEEKVLSEVWSPLVNEGFSRLKKPIRRAKYLLYLVGTPILEGEPVVLEHNFLPEVVELNEEIEVAETCTDLAGLRNDVLDTLQTFYDAFEAAFDEEKDYKKAKKTAMKMQYYESIKKRIAERDHELGC